VSIHSGIAVGVAAAAAYYSLWLALLLGVLAVVVTWARLVLGRHTLAQALAAWAIATFCAVTVFGPWTRWT
jgi:membrane-associated phospholipid phosphatase